MPSIEHTRKIVVDSEGRVTALLELAEKTSVAYEGSLTSLPLEIGDRIDIAAFKKILDVFGIELTVIGQDFAGMRRTDVAGSKEPSVGESHPAVFSDPKLMKHAFNTFGSEKAAEEWLSIECGALNNETPAEFIRKTGDVAEVDRILGCIDYGMTA